RSRPQRPRRQPARCWGRPRTCLRPRSNRAIPDTARVTPRANSPEPSSDNDSSRGLTVMARSDSGITRLINRSKASRTPCGPPTPTPSNSEVIDLKRSRDQLTARVAELQFGLGGLVYEMAVRDQIRVDVLVKRAAVPQDADAELGEVERILRMDQTGTAGA